MAYNFSLSDPTSILREIERLTQRQRELNLADDPAFKDRNPIAAAYGIESGPETITAPLVPGGGSVKSARNREVYQNNAQLGSLMSLASGGTGGGWRARVGVAGRDVTPGAGEYEAARRTSIYAEPDTPKRSAMALDPFSALQEQAGMNPALARDLALQRLRQERARGDIMEGATPFGQEIERGNVEYDLTSGRTGELAQKMQDIKNAQARSAAVSGAATEFDPTVRAAQAIRQDMDLNKIRATKVIPAEIAAQGRIGGEQARAAGVSARGESDAIARLISETIRQLSTTARTPGLAPDDQRRLADNITQLQDLLRTFGMPAPGYPAGGR